MIDDRDQPCPWIEDRDIRRGAQVDVADDLAGPRCKHADAVLSAVGADGKSGIPDQSDRMDADSRDGDGGDPAGLQIQRQHARIAREIQAMRRRVDRRVIPAAAVGTGNMIEHRVARRGIRGTGCRRTHRGEHARENNRQRDPDHGPRDRSLAEARQHQMNSQENARPPALIRPAVGYGKCSGTITALVSANSSKKRRLVVAASAGSTQKQLLHSGSQHCIG